MNTDHLRSQELNTISGFHPDADSSRACHALAHKLGSFRRNYPTAAAVRRQPACVTVPLSSLKAAHPVFSEIVHSNAQRPFSGYRPNPHNSDKLQPLRGNWVRIAKSSRHSWLGHSATPGTGPKQASRRVRPLGAGVRVCGLAQGYHPKIPSCTNLHNRHPHPIRIQTEKAVLLRIRFVSQNRWRTPNQIPPKGDRQAQPFGLSEPVTNRLPFLWVPILQRLFSTFPAGSPGVGLLVLRLGACARIVQCAASLLISPARGPAEATSDIVAVLAAILLLAGLWTPIVASIIAIDEVWIAFSHFSLPSCDPSTRILLAALGASLALLGPGAWSVDARLFGRKLFIDGNRKRGQSPLPKK